MEGLALLLFFLVVLAVDLQRVSADLDINFIRLDARQVDFDLDRAVGFGEIERGEPIARQHAAHTSGLTRRERAARRPTNRRRYRELKDVNAALAALAAPRRVAAEQELEQIDRELPANAVLQSREYSFALYPAETLRSFLTDLPSPVSGK